MLYINYILIGLILNTSGVFSNITLANTNNPETQMAETYQTEVPFYSQFKDISSAKWQKVGCGIASLAMIIDYYKPGQMSSVDKLLEEGISNGAYLNGTGWIHNGLINVSKEYGLNGTAYDLSYKNTNDALNELEKDLDNGPVIASVHYTFDPQNPIPHLVVLNKIEGDNLYYNDPSETSGGKSISVQDFIKGWKKRYIVIRPIA